MKKMRLTIIILLLQGLVLTSGKLLAQNIVSDNTERAALTAIYNSTDGANWNVNQRWTLSKINSFPDSALAGVTILHGDVTAIQLVNNNLTGSLPSELNDLTQLLSLELSQNHLSGTLPTLSGLQHLTRLELTSNSFSGSFPLWVCSLTGLQYLSFAGSTLTGPLPSQISQLTSLVSFSLYHADLSMTNAIPSSFSDLDNLNTLSLVSCGLVPASAPVGLSGLHGLVVLDLSQNPGFIESNGTFPDLLLDLPNLVGLSLQNDDIRLFPAHFNNLTTLQTLSLSDCNFADTTRLRNLVDTLMTMPGLKGLYMPGCHIQNLPANFSQLSSITTLSMANNPINPAGCNEIGDMASLFSLDMSISGLTTVPSNLSNLTTLRTLLLSNNNLNPLPSTLQSISGLQTLDLSYNGLTSLPTWFGTGDMTSIKSLNLNNNSLTLPLTSNFQYLTNLVTLSMAANQLTGTLPSYFSGFSNLATLNLSNNQISSPLPDFSSLSLLRDIRLAHNNLTGKVPASITNTPVTKTYVDISFNHYDTLSSFHSDVNLTVILNNNKLDFFNILKVTRPVRSYVYAPQDTITAPADSLLNVDAYTGDSLVLQVPIDSLTAGGGSGGGTGTGAGTTLYQWWHYVNGVAVPVSQPSTDGTYTNPNFNPSDTSGYYYYTSTNSAVPGLILVSTKYKVKLAPCRSNAKGRFTYSRYVCAYVFFAPVDTQSCKGKTYVWNFGDGRTSADKNPYHAFNSGGTYDVHLTIHYKCGSACAPDTTIHRQVIYNPNEPFNPYADLTVKATTQKETRVISNSVSTFSDSWELQDGNQSTATANEYLTGSAGIWRNDASYVYKVPRSQSAVPDISKDGTYNLEKFNWPQAELGLIPNYIKTNTITAYSAYSYELENQDVLGVYSAALYDYGGHLPSANGVNMRNDEMGFTSFEYLKGNVTGNFIFGNAPAVGIHFYTVKSAHGNMAVVDVKMSNVESFAVGSVTAKSQVPEFWYSQFRTLRNDTIICVTPYTPHPEWTTIVFKQAPVPGAWLGVISMLSGYIPAVIPPIDSTFGHSGKSSLHITTNQTFPQHLLQLDSGKRYLISAWVSVNNANLLTPHLADGLGIDVVIKDKTGTLNSTISMTPVGQIIEGWQQVKGVFTTPIDNAKIELLFKPGSTGQAWYDDLRIHPEAGNMKSYVYDLNDYRLVSTLDEENFASFYFYDKEGNLYLLKKETERGVKTISENVSYITEQR